MIGKIFIFLTNQMTLPAATIRAHSTLALVRHIEARLYADSLRSRN